MITGSALTKLKLWVVSISNFFPSTYCRVAIQTIFTQIFHYFIFNPTKPTTANYNIKSKSEN